MLESTRKHTPRKACWQLARVRGKSDAVIETRKGRKARKTSKTEYEVKHTMVFRGLDALEVLVSIWGTVGGISKGEKREASQGGGVCRLKDI